MCQAAVERTLGKLVTDESFRGRFFREPAAASFSAGLELSRAELDALSRLPVEAIVRFSACLDDRICRLPLDEEGRPAGQPSQATPRRRRRRTSHKAGQAECSAQPTQEDTP